MKRSQPVLRYHTTTYLEDWGKLNEFSLRPSLSHKNPLRTLTPPFCKIGHNCIIQSAFSSPRFYSPSRLSDLFFMLFSNTLHACHIPCQSHLSGRLIMNVWGRTKYSTCKYSTTVAGYWSHMYPQRLTKIQHGGRCGQCVAYCHIISEGHMIFNVSEGGTNEVCFKMNVPFYLLVYMHDNTLFRYTLIHQWKRKRETYVYWKMFVTLYCMTVKHLLREV
jgi:hypothetical protein